MEEVPLHELPGASENNESASHCTCDILKAKLEEARNLLSQRDALLQRVCDLEHVIENQEGEVDLLLNRIDQLTSGEEKNVLEELLRKKQFNLQAIHEKFRSEGSKCQKIKQGLEGMIINVSEQKCDYCLKKEGGKSTKED